MGCLSWCYRGAPKEEVEVRSSKRRYAKEALVLRWEMEEPEGRRRVRPWPKVAAGFVARLKSNIELSIFRHLGDTINRHGICDSSRCDDRGATVLYWNGRVCGCDRSEFCRRSEGVAGRRRLSANWRQEAGYSLPSGRGIFQSTTAYSSQGDEMIRCRRWNTLFQQQT